MPKDQKRFWLLSLAVLVIVCGASPLFFAPFSQADPPQPCGQPAALEELLRAHGGFDCLEEVCAVKGISQKTVDGWNGLAYVS